MSGSRFPGLARRRFPLRALASIVVLTLIAGPLSSMSALAQPKPLKKVTIAVGSMVLNVTYPWLMLPMALGYWRDEGYDVNVVGVSGSAQGLQQLASGCPRRANIEPPCRPNSEPGVEADVRSSACG